MGDYRAPFGDAVVTLPAELAERYEAAGWVAVDEKKKAPARKAPGSSDEK